LAAVFLYEISEVARAGLELKITQKPPT